MNAIRKISLALAFALVGFVATPAHATALSAARQTSSKNTGAIKRYLMKASTTIYAGGLVMIDSAGKALPAAASASNHGCVGIALETKTSAASGSYYMTVQEGWFLLAGATLEQEDVGLPVYAADDQTVDETAASNLPVAGVLMEYVGASSGWVHVSLTYTSRHNVTSDPLTMTGDLTLSGGAGALTFTDSATSVVLPDNDTTAGLIGSTGRLNLITFDTADSAETVLITGTTATTALDVAVGEAVFAETATFTLGQVGPVNTVTGTDTLVKGDCSRLTIVTAGIDTQTITLPEASTVLGCELTISYTGADAGALVDITPLDSDADGIEGGCTLAASVVTFSGTIWANN
jgi:hypothetical protein